MTALNVALACLALIFLTAYSWPVGPVLAVAVVVLVVAAWSYRAGRRDGRRDVARWVR